MSEATEVKAAPSGKIAEALELISGMTVLELSQFVKAAEEKFGVSAAAPVAVAPQGGGGTTAAPAAAEEAATVTVTLTAAGEQKLQTIKVVREVTNPPLGLKEAKALVDGAPKVLAEGVTREDAAKMKEKLEAVGAKVEIK
jgi:large subunit ribosomal protein L7/L12